MSTSSTFSSRSSRTTSGAAPRRGRMSREPASGIRPPPPRPAVGAADPGAVAVLNRGMTSSANSRMLSSTYCWGTTSMNWWMKLMPSNPTFSQAAMASATSSGVPMVTPLNDLAASPGLPDSRRRAGQQPLRGIRVRRQHLLGRQQLRRHVAEHGGDLEPVAPAEVAVLAARQEVDRQHLVVDEGADRVAHLDTPPVVRHLLLRVRETRPATTRGTRARGPPRRARSPATSPPPTSAGAASGSAWAVSPAPAWRTCGRSTRSAPASTSWG